MLKREVLKKLKMSSLELTESKDQVIKLYLVENWSSIKRKLLNLIEIKIKGSNKKQRVWISLNFRLQINNNLITDNHLKIN